MSANVLGARKVRQIAAATGHPIIWAFVWSHRECGRVARCTTADHRHGWFDRRTGEWEDDDPAHPDQCGSSCRILFADDADPDTATMRADAMHFNPYRDIVSDMPVVLFGGPG